MSNQPLTIDEKLKIGIDAARAGRNQEAQTLLRDVLAVEADNIPAMFWLAFVLPDARDSMRLLERVLTLDPQNARAKAGIQWAKSRLQEAPPPEEAQTEEAVTEPEPAAEPSVTPPDEEIDLSTLDGAALREKLLSGETNEEARKGPLAHRARRTFDLSILILALTALGLLTLGMGTLVLGPTDTLAAWLPREDRATSQTAAASKIVFRPASEVQSEVDSLLEANSDQAKRNLASETDTILMELPELMGIEAVDLPQTSQPLSAPAPAVDPVISIADPANLIGPQVSDAPQVNNLLLAHQPAYPGEKWIEVNVSTQQITAWEGDVPLMTFMGSTGLPNTPTVLGSFNIYWKLESTLMTGPNYYLPEVPHTMYFYRGYALHGAYWHNNFGQPMSHGCVNLNLDDAKTLFEWADPVIPLGQTQVVATADNPGTLVVVHQ